MIDKHQCFEVTLVLGWPAAWYHLQANYTPQLKVLVILYFHFNTLLQKNVDNRKDNSNSNMFN
jgi:hypothetical protein